MRWKAFIAFAVLMALTSFADSKKATVTGYVIDSACAYTKDLDRPISEQCAQECAKAGSPLVILAEDGTVYWPIDNARPAHGQNKRLMKVAGKKVTVSGQVHDRGGSKAIVIETVEASK
ncbi:MAG TPA: hypothetical protein VLA96_06000 [Terriglobales bacterium]|jgi:hypothetical protein|nr:hypothetical protein [Terriglobales bacterium]